MDSGKQKRARIMARRRQRRERAVLTARADDCSAGGLPVDEHLLAWAGYHSYGVPDFVTRGRYVDRPFRCRDCGSEEVWSAAQQKWWYETAHGSLYTTAVRCRACRQARRSGGTRSTVGRIHSPARPRQANEFAPTGGDGRTLCPCRSRPAGSASKSRARTTA